MTSATLPLKERAINADRVARIAREIHAVLPSFPANVFVSQVLADLPQLELKARIARVSRALHENLSTSTGQALDVLLASLPPTPEAAGVTNDFGLHLYSPHSDYVARYHRTSADLESALEALRTFTRYFSAEDAVRQFVNDFPAQTLSAVYGWARDEDYRVRRLASESIRPNLPWSAKISLPADTGLPILEQLYTDPAKFVVQSVANHLRDIAATNPDLVLATLTRWRDAGQASGKQITFIAREALKTRLKQGWPAAYEFLGYATDAAIDVAPIRLHCSRIAAGESLVFDADISTVEAQALQVQYVISEPGQHGHTREKVYFLCRANAVANGVLTLTRQHPLRTIGTAKITPGGYVLALQVNGKRFPSVSFEVI